MPKNVSVYLNDKLVSKLEKYPEVNVSEVMRQGLENYIDNRETNDSVLERVNLLEQEVQFLKTSFNSNFEELDRRISSVEHDIEK